MMRRLLPSLATAFALSISLVLPAAAQSGSDAVARDMTLEDASRLTWRAETRGRGIAALRTMVTSAPESLEPRFELGRVLTWDAGTRAEGITLLRAVATAAPDRVDVAETLAEVLAWSDVTRGEATVRLRALVEKEPARTSARLKLAEVLSWNPATREESRRHYQRVLQDDERSVEAAVGLARVLSWSGRFAESRGMYELALARDPGAQAARVGIAEIDAWTGRARASLRTLSAYPSGVIDTPDAIRLRAQAYSQIGRPARALEQYDQWLALEPGNRAAQQAARQIRRRLRPVIEIGGEASDESGDAVNRVQTSSLPLRFSFHPGRSDAEISLTAAMADYQNASGSSRDTSAGIGVDVAVGNRVRLSGDVMGHEFDRAARTYTGRGQFQLALHDNLDVRVGGAREQLSSSRLSLGGEQLNDVFYGPSFVDQVVVGAGARLGLGFDAWAHATKGRIRGTNISDNRREELFAGFGKSFHPGVLTLRPGYSLAWMSYDLDLGGFPSDGVNGDGVSAPGIGGYFSPRRFLNQMARFDATLPAGSWLVIAGGAGVGKQQVEDAWSRDFGRRVTSSEAYLSVRVNAADRVAIGTQLTYQDVAAAFDRTALRVTLGYGF